jgi:peptidoglycan/xylan/chitin deacetylase (PgdA/CDA1 family)
MKPAPWVCLMYHDVSTAPVGVSGGPQHFSVTRRGFAAQLDQLAGEGFAGRSIAECLATPARRQVAISFDDGDLGQFENGHAELVKRGMTATFFITTDWVGRPGYVSWSQLREMRATGMSIGSHSRSHPFLSELKEAALRAELLGSKDVLDQELCQVTDTIALPGGDRPKRGLRPVLSQAGYRVVATSRWGVNRAREADGLQWVRRCTVRGEPDPGYFARMLRGDGWLGFRRSTRELTLRTLREALGPTRYARWRRRLLDAVRT